MQAAFENHLHLDADVLAVFLSGLEAPLLGGFLSGLIEAELAVERLGDFEDRQRAVGFDDRIEPDLALDLRAHGLAGIGRLYALDWHRLADAVAHLVDAA